MIEGGSNAAFFVFGYNPNEINGGHFHTFLAARARLGESSTFTFSHFHATMWENTAYDAVLTNEKKDCQQPIVILMKKDFSFPFSERSDER